MRVTREESLRSCSQCIRKERKASSSFSPHTVTASSSSVNPANGAVNTTTHAASELSGLSSRVQRPRTMCNDGYSVDMKGRRKPWFKDCQQTDCPKSSEYDAYAHIQASPTSSASTRSSAYTAFSDDRTLSVTTGTSKASTNKKDTETKLPARTKQKKTKPKAPKEKKTKPKALQ